MITIEYLDAIKMRLLTDSLVDRFQVIRERVTPADSHLRARLTLADGSTLEFSEYAQHSDNDQINVITYSYHWADVAGQLICRWDNTPHFPDLPGFPHHIHDGRSNSVNPGEPVNIFSILDEIARRL